MLRWFGQFGTHDKLGMQVIPLALLSPHETKEFTLNLVKNKNLNDPHNKKPRGQLVVELSYNPFKEGKESFSEPLEGRTRNETEIQGRTIEEPPSFQGGLLLVMVQGAQDVEGKNHTNPYALVLFRGEQKKTKVR